MNGIEVAHENYELYLHRFNLASYDGWLDWPQRTALNPVAVSFEFFPPSDEIASRNLWSCIARLAPLRPDFVSVTYGADGSTRDRTRDCVLRILRETELTVTPHLTCQGASRAEVVEIARDYWHLGVRRLVALRGDLPVGDAQFKASRVDPGVFVYASELVAGVTEVGPFDVSVAAYPEGHPETGSIEADVENLRRKIAAGARRAITQFFFDTEVFLRYRDRCVRAGIDAEIVPGILPITRFSQVRRFAERCRAAIPAAVARQFEGLDDDPETHRLIAASVAIEQVQRLRAHGVERFHFYTLNRAELTVAVCHSLGVRAPVREARVA